MNRKSFLIALMMLLPFVLFAQRTAKGQFFADVEGVFSFTSVGAGITFGQYVSPGYWSASILGVNRVADMVTSSGQSSDLDYLHVGASGNFMYRFISTDSRALSFYAGGGLFLGAEVPDPFGKQPNGGVLPFGTRFLYELFPELAMEVFPINRVAFVVKFRTPVNFSSSVGHFNYELGAALRLNF